MALGSEHCEAADKVGFHPKFGQFNFNSTAMEAGSPFTSSRLVHSRGADRMSFATLADVNLREMREGVNDWSNIQDVLRHSFACLFETIARQQEQIDSLSSQLSVRRRGRRRGPGCGRRGDAGDCSNRHLYRSPSAAALTRNGSSAGCIARRFCKCIW